MLGARPMVDAGARELGESADGKRQQRHGLLPPLLRGQRILGALDGHLQAPGVGIAARVARPAHHSPNPEETELSPGLGYDRLADSSRILSMIL